jgi:hypothetical protein
MKAKTKRRLRHVLTKKKLVKKKTSRHVLRTFLIALATISTGSLAYAITLNKPTVSVPIHNGPGGIKIEAPMLAPAPTPEPANGPVVQSGRGSWYALGLPEPDALTCASRTFPRGTYLAVTDLASGDAVTCLVNDYGPAVWTGRVIDLSRGSFRQVDNLGVGTIPVQIRIANAPATGRGPGSSPYLVNLHAVVGYQFCENSHTAQYCDAHRQD